MARPFKLSNVLLNPNARVYNLRLLLLADVVITVLVGMYLGPAGLAQADRRLLVGFIGGIVIGTHHVLVYVVTLREVFMALIRISIEHSLFRLPISGPALIDLLLVFLEVCGE